MSRERLAVLALIVLLSTGSQLGAAQPWCTSAPGCFSNGRQLSHYALSSEFPFSEDISPAPDTFIQWDPAHAQDYWNQPWTVVQSACACQPGPPGNIVTTATTHVLLRGTVTVHGDTSSIPAGTPMEIQLVVDGTPYGHYLKRLRVAVPGTDDAYVVEASVKELPQGTHTFSMRARLLAPATVFVGGYTTSVGVPASSYGSERTATAGAVLIESYVTKPQWTSLTVPLQIDQSVPIDLALQGYVQVDATPGAYTLLFRFIIDGVPQPGGRQSLTSVPSLLPDGINVLDHWLNLPPGPHTVELQAATDAGSATLSWRQLEFVAFPHNLTSPAVETTVVTGANPPCDVMSNDASGSCTDGIGLPANQPIAAVQNDGNGSWTLLAETEFPLGTTGNIGSWMIDGYVQFRGGKPGIPGPDYWGQLAVETVTRDGAPNCSDKATDMAIFNFVIPSTNRGFWFYGDAGQWGVSDQSCSSPVPTRVRLWIRPVLIPEIPAQPARGFLVGDRYFSAKLVPPGTGACTFDAPPTPVGAKLYTVDPCRVADTRGPVGPYGGPALPGQRTRPFTLTGVCGIPASAKAVVANVTATQPSALGRLQVFPSGQRPDGLIGSTWTVNYSSGQTRGNNVQMGLSCEGRVDVLPDQNSSSNVHVIIDVLGYYQ